MSTPIIRWYDTFSRFFSVTRDYPYAPIRREAVERLSLAPGDTVFDVFCGTGASFPLLIGQIGHSGQVIAVDGSVGMLAKAKQTAIATGISPDRLELLQIDLSTSAGQQRLAAHVREVGARKYIFVLGLTCLANWRECFAAVWAAAPTGSQFVIMDVYRAKMTRGARLITWIGSGSLRGNGIQRPVWLSLQAHAADFGQKIFHPFRLLDVEVRLSWGSKSPNR